MTKYGTFEELLASSAEPVVAIAWRLRTLIFDLHPAAVEVVRLGDPAAAFGVGEKKMSEAYCYIMPQRDRINLGFFYGARLQDAAELLEGTGKMLRHVKVRTLAQANSTAIRQLLVAAHAERRDALGLK